MSKRKRRADRSPQDRRERQPKREERAVYEGIEDEPLLHLRDELLHMWQAHRQSPIPLTVGHLRKVLNEVPELSDEAPVVVRDVWMIDAPPIPVDGVGIGVCDEQDCTDPGHRDVILVVGMPRDPDVKENRAA
jgi:hypothetical protein